MSAGCAQIFKVYDLLEDLKTRGINYCAVCNSTYCYKCWTIHGRTIVHPAHKCQDSNKEDFLKLDS